MIFPYLCDMAGIYIHIPFCGKRCIYCDFFSSTSSRQKDLYVDAVCREMQLQKDYLQGENIETIYFGGGTPSQLQAGDFSRIFDSIQQTFFPETDNCFSGKEITLEANPDDMTPAYLESLRHLPFNRISMGVQSFRDEDLSFLNRRHDAAGAIEAVKDCRKAGFENISIDLIYGLPGQTLAGWMKNLDIALSLDIRHISAYHLTYEEGTGLYRLLEEGKIHPVEEELSLHMFKELIDRLNSAGWIHYEISNFARPGYFSRHNSSYWNGTHYLGLGASAHSYDGKSRQWNISSLEKYIESIFLHTIPAEKEIIDLRTAYNDYILTGLRTIGGIDLQKIEEFFGTEEREYCLTQAQKHLLPGNLIQEGNKITLSPDGIFLSDGIMSDLLIVP